MQPSSWATRHPRVYRYLERQYVDEYFASGKLMLSSFERFAKHTDEQRLDSKEGKTYLMHRTDKNGGQTLLVEADFGHDAYVLSGSTLPSVDLMNAFGANSAIVIKDPIRFAHSVGNALNGYRQGFDGPCSYQLRRIIEHDFGWIALGPTEETDDLSKFNQQTLKAAIDRMVSPDAYFLKNSMYVAQAEWRFVWIVNRTVTDNVILVAPESRQFCVPWELQGDIIAFGGGRV